MKIALISYSLTGNNDALARAVADPLGAEHITLIEQKSRKTGTIIADLLFNRMPKVQPPAGGLNNYDAVVFVGPVWIGQPASPLWPYMKVLKAHSRPYAFVSISGGADDNPNSKLAENLTKRTGHAPEAVVDLHIADLLPKTPKPTREITSAYRLSADEIKMHADKVLEGLRGKLREKKVS